MVFTGWSDGCDRCRQAHTRCDATRPACKRCTTRGLTCPGFRKDNGVIFKDVTQAVATRHGKKKSIKKLSPLSKEPVKLEQIVQHIPCQVKLDVEAIAIDFFFLNCIYNSCRDGMLSSGLFDHLVPLYTSSLQNSLLTTVVPLLAIQALYLFCGPTAEHAYLEAETNAFQSLQSALADPVESQSDETLFSILAMDFCSNVRSTLISEEPATRAHLGGALALIQKRGTDNHATKISRSLLSATRSSGLLQTLWSDNMFYGDAVAALPFDDDHTLENAESTLASLHDLLARTFTIEWQIMRDSTHLTSEARARFVRSQRIPAMQALKYVDKWYARLSPPWMTIATLFSVCPPPSSLPGEHSMIMQIVYTLGQWHCVRLGALKMVYITSDDHQTRLDAAEQARITTLHLTNINAYLQAGGLVTEVMNDETPIKGERPTARMSESLRPALVQDNYSLNLIQWFYGIMGEDLYQAEGFDVGPELWGVMKVQSMTAQQSAPSRKNLTFANLYY